MKISQARARYYKKRMEEMDTILRRQKNRWALEFAPGWVNIEAICLTPESYAKLSTARLLGHAVVVVPANRGTEVRLYADRLGDGK